MTTNTTFRTTRLSDLRIGDRVIVNSYGWNTRMADVGRRGSVVAIARTRVSIALEPGGGIDYPERVNFRPEVLGVTR